MEFCKSGNLPEFLTCTQRLQEWNKPRPRKVNPIPVLELTSRRKELLRAKGNPRPVPTQYDPRPASLRCPDPVQLENLRTDLLQINRPFCLNQLLRAPIHIALHDHNYAASGVHKPLPVTTSTGTADKKSRLCPCAENRVDISLLKQAIR